MFATLRMTFLFHSPSIIGLYRWSRLFPCVDRHLTQNFFLASHKLWSISRLGYIRWEAVRSCSTISYLPLTVCNSKSIHSHVGRLWPLPKNLFVRIRCKSFKGMTTSFILSIDKTSTPLDPPLSHTLRLSTSSRMSSLSRLGSSSTAIYIMLFIFNSEAWRTNHVTSKNDWKFRGPGFIQLREDYQRSIHWWITNALFYFGSQNLNTLLIWLGPRMYEGTNWRTDVPTNMPSLLLPTGTVRICLHCM